MQAHEEDGRWVVARGDKHIAEDESARGERDGIGAGSGHYGVLELDCRSRSMITSSRRQLALDAKTQCWLQEIATLQKLFIAKEMPGSQPDIEKSFGLDCHGSR